MMESLVMIVLLLVVVFPVVGILWKFFRKL